MSLAPDVMPLLGDRGIHLGLDTYDGSLNEDVTPGHA
jgi:hypothetical protein